MAIIKAGTYRFKDNIDLSTEEIVGDYGSFRRYIDFLVNPELTTVIDEANLKVTINANPDSSISCTAVDVALIDGKRVLQFYTTTALLLGSEFITVYTPEHGWNALANEYVSGTEDGITLEVNADLSKWGQIIEIPNDQETYDAVVEWFETVTDPVTSDTVAEVTYNGATLVTLNAGETKTLKCAGLKMKTDVVIKM